MWPFRRNRDAAEAPAPEPAATGPVHRAGPAAWRDAPPLRVLQPSRTTIDPAFVSRLATRADPSFLGALGHHVMDEAPAGSVHGLAVADRAPRSFAPPPSGSRTAQRMITDPAQTRAPGPSARPPTDVADIAGVTDEPTAVAVPLAATPRRLVDASVVDLPPVPARAAVQLRPGPDDVAAPESAAPTTERDAPPAMPDPAASTTSISPTIGASDPAPTPATAALPSTPTIVSRVVEGGPATSRLRPRIGVPIERPAPTSTHGPAATPPADQGRADAPRRTPDQPTAPTDARPDDSRAGLVGDSPLGLLVPEAAADGVPTPARPAVPTVQTAVSGPTAGPPVRSARPTAPPPSTTGAPPAVSGPTPAPPRMAPIGPPLQRRADSPPVTPTVGLEPLTALSPDGPSATPPVEPVTPTAPSATTPGPSGPTALPTPSTVATQPTVLRQPVGSTPTGATPTSATPGAPRLRGDGRPSSVVVATPIGAGRTAAEPAVPAAAQAADVAPAVQLVPLLGDRIVGAPRSDRDPADERPPAAAPVVARPATGPSPSSLAGSAPVASSPSMLTVVARSVSMPAAVSRLVDAASAAPAPASSATEPAPLTPARPTESYVPPWVQRAEDPAGTPTPPTTAEVMPSAAATVDMDETTARGPSAAEIDRLAQALYPQLRRRLGRDLLNDRERLGYRTDIRF